MKYHHDNASIECVLITQMGQNLIEVIFVFSFFATLLIVEFWELTLRTVVRGNFNIHGTKNF